MAFTVEQLSQYYSNNWKHINVLNGSKIAVLFANELRPTGGAFMTSVRFPVMTEAQTQDDWDQKTGFKEQDATEKIVEVKLTNNFTSYTKIDWVNVPANWETWATNKIVTVRRQEATILDNFVLKQICSGVKNSISDDSEITKDNIVKAIKTLEKEAYKKKWRLEDGLIFVSSDVMIALLDSKLTSVMNNIENTNAVVTKILNKYSIVEAPVDDYGFQMVALLPQSFAWASALQTPLMAGVYTQGPFLGQIFTAINRFFGGAILLPDQILGVKKKSGETPPPEENDGQDSSLNAYKNQALDEMITINPDLSKNSYLKKKMASAKNVQEIDALKAKFTQK